MFDDILEAWDYLAEAAAKKGTPEAERLTHRMGVGMTKQATGKYDKNAPPPIPGTPENRRKTLLKSMGIKSLGMRTSGKRPPPLPIRKGTKVAGVDLGDSKNESLFGEAMVFWDKIAKAQRYAGGGPDKG